MFVIIKSLLVLLLIALLVIPVVFVVSGVEQTPLIQSGKSLSHEDVERIKQLLRLHDPRRLKHGGIRTLALSERDLNLLLNYSMASTLGINSRVDLYPASVGVSLTYRLPQKYSGNYVNASARLSPTADSMRIDALKIGRLSLPGWLLNPVLQFLHAHMLEEFAEYRTVMQAVGEIRVNEERVVVVYQWHPELAARLKSRGYGLLFSTEDKARVLAYYNKLNRLAGEQASHRVSLEKVFPPLFKLAGLRADERGDLQAENRAMLLTLAMYVLGVDVGRFVDVPPAPRPRRMYLTVLNRHDLAQHFTVSAALTVSAGGGLANAIGLFKELDDSRDGTGFSFDDLLADRAGVRLAEQATGTAPQVRLLLQRMNGQLSEADFMPSIDRLPPSIMELEFKQKYRDLDSEKYRMVDDEIEKRILHCSIYQPA
ncbi:MAG TPA: hypothetical protein DCO71_01090 [Gammaproteobacteria bacterium]|nr:hypothetical protein [Gammaproteobacteria bacterium]